MKVIIDSRETRRIETATEYYEKKGLIVETAELPVGDYIFSDGKNEVVFEYKTIADFFSSIQDGRVFNQAISQAEEFDHHFIIIDGNLYDRNKAIALSRNFGRTINTYQYLGAIASLNRITTVIQCYNPEIEEVFYTMMITAKKCMENKQIVKKFPRKHKNPCFNFLAYCCRNISAVKAKKIVDTLQLETLNDLQKLTIEDLTSVPGIGPKTGQSILDGLK